MKNVLLTFLWIVFASTIHAGPACCGAGAKTKKVSGDESANLGKEKATSAACNLDDLSSYIRSGKKLTTNDLQDLLEAKANIVLVDARTPKWDDGKRIASAKNLTPQSSKEAIESTLGSKDSYIVTYCGSVQCPLSHKMADRLKELGYANTLVYPEGIAGWITAGNAVN